MALYRKLPIIVNAEQAQVVTYVETPEGIMRADPGDYIITGIMGERYPCKKEIFAVSYEQVGTGDVGDIYTGSGRDSG